MTTTDVRGRAVICRVALLMIAIALLGCRDAEPSYPLLGGGALVLSELHGKLVVINYWAEWCAPCREEIPELNAFAAAHPAEVGVFSVNFDGASGASLEAQIAALGIAFPTLLRDPRPELPLPPPQALPETLVFDRAGNVQQVLSGPQTRAALEQALALAVPPTRDGQP